MLEEKDLQAIAQLILSSEDRMRTEIQASEERMKGYVQEEIRASETRMKDYMQGEVQASETRTHAFIESGVMKQVRLLAEGHEQILERLPEAEEIDSLRSRVRTLERIVTEHSQEIGELKRAQ
ncbi:hypothetical protein [Clostridium sp. D33t1_170424_F3]|uniref:hypothetical protein n=1 Tax=Clostridium sp. D33t1_170424_F3 TaxID=2787099 RepID=UPI0018ABE7C2|nr:hypothetical protein [Clostridium sp. D33t1_170424_F3]